MFFALFFLPLLIKKTYLDDKSRFGLQARGQNHFGNTWNEDYIVFQNNHTNHTDVGNQTGVPLVPTTESRLDDGEVEWEQN